MIQSLEIFYSQIAKILLERTRISLELPATSSSQTHAPSLIMAEKKIARLTPPLVLGDPDNFSLLEIWDATMRTSCKQAGVLIPLIYKEGQHYIILTRRTEQVEYHKGEISFPGGAHDPEDRNLQETALRETEEEIGIPSQDVQILGALDDAFTIISHFVVTPYLGVIQYPYCPKINPNEAKEILEIPLLFFYEEQHYREKILQMQDKQVKSYVFQWKEDSTIWGMTAYIIKNFCNILRENHLLDKMG